jgi:hypothetical protein
MRQKDRAVVVEGCCAEGLSASLSLLQRTVTCLLGGLLALRVRSVNYCLELSLLYKQMNSVSCSSSSNVAVLNDISSVTRLRA